MLMYAAVLALAVVAQGQVLRISPAVIGASSAGQQHVIQLGNGGSRPVAVGRVVAAKPVAYVAQPAPYVVAQPAPYVVAQPAPYVVAKPAAVAAAIQPAFAAAKIVEGEKPSPFAFAFDSEDELGTKIARQESANEQGVVNGQYSFSDAAGILRVVKYIADENGFRADVQTNEPGTLTSNPADVQIKSTAQ